jgi:hypothetical protein
MFSLVARRLDWNQHAPSGRPCLVTSVDLNGIFVYLVAQCFFGLSSEFGFWTHVTLFSHWQSSTFFAVKYWNEVLIKEIWTKCPTLRPAQWTSTRSPTHPAHVVRSPILGYLKNNNNKEEKFEVFQVLFWPTWVSCWYWRQFSNVWNSFDFILTGSMIRILRRWWLCRR